MDSVGVINTTAIVLKTFRYSFVFEEEVAEARLKWELANLIDNALINCSATLV